MYRGKDFLDTGNHVLVKTRKSGTRRRAVGQALPSNAFKGQAGRMLRIRIESLLLDRCHRSRHIASRGSQRSPAKRPRFRNTDMLQDRLRVPHASRTWHLRHVCDGRAGHSTSRPLSTARARAAPRKKRHSRLRTGLGPGRGFQYPESHRRNHRDQNNLQPHPRGSHASQPWGVTVLARFKTGDGLGQRHV